MAAKYILAAIGLFYNVQQGVCQGGGGMMGMMVMIPRMVNNIRETTAREALMNTVKFVVGETATPSPEMVSFAVVAGASPTTQAERDAYLEMLKNVARKTPEVTARYMKTKTVNGTVTETLDTIALDAYITKKAMQYGAASKAMRARKRKEEEQKRQHELELLRTSQLHELNLVAMMGIGSNSGGQMGATQAPPGMDAFYMDSTSFFGDPMGTVPHNPPNNFNNFQQNNNPPNNFNNFQQNDNFGNPAGQTNQAAGDGMVSLTDIFKMLDTQMNTGTGNTAPVTAAPTTVAPNNNNFDMSNALLLSSMPMK